MDNIAVNIEDVSKTFKIGMPRTILKVLKKMPSPEQQKTIKALDGISIQIKKGEVLGIIGHNGSGKSTLLRIISGIYNPDRGSVKVNGRLSPLLQLGAGFHGDLNAVENIIMSGMLIGLTKSEIKERVDSILEFSGLEKFSNMKVKHFSSGMWARLAFAVAMQTNPDILLIDEILSVGDMQFQEKSYNTILSMKENKKTIIHATHNLEKLVELSDRVLLLDNGKQLMIDKPVPVIQKYIEISKEKKLI